MRYIIEWLHFHPSLCLQGLSKINCVSILPIPVEEENEVDTEQDQVIVKQEPYIQPASAYLNASKPPALIPIAKPPQSSGIAAKNAKQAVQPTPAKKTTSKRRKIVDDES